MLTRDINNLTDRVVELLCTLDPGGVYRADISQLITLLQANQGEA